MQKIISFSLFGDDPKYYVGAEKNIVLNKKLLPDWETIIYYLPEKIKLEYVDKLKELGGILIDVSDVVIGERNPIDYPFFWRFLTFLNDGIHLVRDLDSRMSDREVEYIRKWEQNDCKYFIIRDHPWHAPVPSGLFGIKGKDFDFEKHFHEYIKNNNLVWGTDQDILYQYIQNIESKNIFYCGFDEQENYIPRKDKSFFIGMQLDENDNPTEPSGVTCLNFLNEINL
jgi:hypothetical protein